jgi:hypothetical protein
VITHMRNMKTLSTSPESMSNFLRDSSLMGKSRQN